MRIQIRLQVKKITYLGGYLCYKYNSRDFLGSGLILMLRFKIPNFTWRLEYRRQILFYQSEKFSAYILI